MLLDNIMYSTVESDQSSCFSMPKSGFEIYNPTIFEFGKNHLFVDHDKNVLCDSYIVNFIHDATESYYERGKYGFMYLNNIKFPLFMLKTLELHLFCFSMLVALCFHDLFSYKIPLHRKWVRLKCVGHLLLDAPFASFSIFMRASLKLLSLAERY